MPAITVNRLKKIIKEELQALHEGDIEDQGAAINRACSDLIKAVEKFKTVSSAKAKSIADSSGTSLESHLKEAEKLLKRITDTPKEYVDGPKPSVEPAATGVKMSIQPKVKK